MIGKKATCKSCGHKFKITTNTAPRIQAEPIQKEDKPALRNPGQITQGKNLSNAKQRIHHGKVGMWDIKPKYLQESEAIEYTDCPSMLSCILAYIWAGFVFFGVMVNLIISIRYNTNMTSTLLYSLLLALPAIYIILRRLSTRYAISNRGLLKRVGIITTSIKSVPFKHITSIEVKETIAGKIFRYAHLLIDTSGSGRAIEFRWNYVKVAHNVKKLIEKHLAG